MRDLATEPQKAYRHLGSEHGRAFISLIADFKAALFAGDVPGGPLSVKRDGSNFELEWFVATGCKLKTVVAAQGSNEDAWKDAHRIRLEAISLGGKVIF